MESQQVQMPSFNLNLKNNIFKHYLKESDYIAPEQFYEDSNNSDLDPCDNYSSPKISSEQKDEQGISQSDNGPSELVFDVDEEDKDKAEEKMDEIKKYYQLIEELIKQNRTMTVNYLAKRLNISVKIIRHYLMNKKFQSIERAVEDIMRDNPRQTAFHISSRIHRRFGVKTTTKEVTDIIRKKLHYIYACAKPKRIQHALQKKDTVEVLDMRMKFCQYLRKNHYKTKDIYFCGVVVYSFEIKGNYIWIPQNYLGIVERDYQDFKFRDSEAVVLITISTEGIIRQDLLSSRITESILMDHLREGYLKILEASDKDKSILILSNTLPEEVFSKWYVEEKLTNKKWPITSSFGQISEIQYLRERAALMKALCNKLGLKKYLNEPPYSHRLNPLQGLFMKIDNTLNAPQLDRLFFKNVMNMQLFQRQLLDSLKHVGKRQCQHFYHSLELYLTIPQIDRSMFLDKHWEDVFFDNFDNSKI